MTKLMVFAFDVCRRTAKTDTRASANGTTHTHTYTHTPVCRTMFCWCAAAACKLSCAQRRRRCRVRSKRWCRQNRARCIIDAAINDVDSRPPHTHIIINVRILAQTSVYVRCAAARASGSADRDKGVRGKRDRSDLTL